MTDLKNQYLIRRQQVITPVGTPPTKRIDQQNPQVGRSFEDVLKQVGSKEEVKFSKHASQRLEERNIQLTDAELLKINDAVDKAASKGIREALILMDDKVFIANVKNRVIVTASDEKNLKAHVFTNIDGAVIV